MGEYKRFELFTGAVPLDLTAPFDAVVGQSPDGMRVEAWIGAENNHVSIYRYERPRKRGQRAPFVLVGIDTSLSDISPDELAPLLADTLVYFVQRPDIDGGTFEDLEECRYLTWERGAPVVVNTHPLMSAMPLGRALVTALDRAGVAREGVDLGLYFEPTASFLIRNQTPPRIEELWSGWLAEGVSLAGEISAMASLLGTDSGVDQTGYEEFEVRREAFVQFASDLLARSATDPDVLAHRTAIVRVLAMALRAGLEPASADPLVAEARALG